MNLEIVEAKQEDKDFVLHANMKIDEASYIETSKLFENLDKDIFMDKKAVCLLAKVNNKKAGMVLFSKVYWADRGEGVYVSQVYVEPEFRGNGILKELFKEAFNYYPNTKFLTCLVAKKNEKMVKCMGKTDFEDEGMISYAKNKADFNKTLNK